MRLIDDSEDVNGAQSERMNLSIAVQPVTTMVEYVVPEDTVIQDMLTLDYINRWSLEDERKEIPARQPASAPGRSV